MKKHYNGRNKSAISKLAVGAGLLFWFSVTLFLSQVAKINLDNRNYVAGSMIIPHIKNSIQKPAPIIYEGKIVIIIDDIGREMESLQRLSKLQLPFTISILPYLKYSREAAIFAHQNGWEVMMHVPMEPLNYPEKNPGTNALMSYMSQDELQEKFIDIYTKIPYVKGFNNHMGSLFTTLPHKMQYIMKIASMKDIYFIDSKTTHRSSALRVAIENNVSASERTLFIDSVINEEIIIENLLNLFKTARERSFAIAICHAYPETLNALSKLAPLLAENNQHLVHASEVVYSIENKAYVNALYLQEQNKHKKAKAESDSLLLSKIDIPGEKIK
ncbi:MAG: hypothetical protein A2Y62_21285 [Candidatus Fischerbacteria bacterium RBG_13_37_8]|uniref:Divergent polysaccharide deacetylase n=1 Tax=Candidatus Fischerbacteria bacterium RBG_13_37_8 TaxID=1817863 RepID=A0A1F5VNZ5_9BACT|nr:MAG: hypothetical protein A2Y62_21285 [Candidatus Fischerbacteria bacterium RBG_13_37_8]